MSPGESRWLFEYVDGGHLTDLPPHDGTLEPQAHGVLVMTADDEPIVMWEQGGEIPPEQEGAWMTIRAAVAAFRAGNREGWQPADDGDHWYGLLEVATDLRELVPGVADL